MRERAGGGGLHGVHGKVSGQLCGVAPPSTCLLECHSAHQVVQQIALPTELLHKHLLVSFNKNKSLEHKDAQSTVQCTLCNYQELLES